MSLSLCETLTPCNYRDSGGLHGPGANLSYIRGAFSMHVICKLMTGEGVKHEYEA